jgi:hypothetical protein
MLASMTLRTVSIVVLLSGCAGLVPTRRYVVEPVATDPQSHSVMWYEHVSGPGIGTVPGDEEVHVVLCNERVSPPCVRLEIDDIDDSNRRAVLDRLDAARADTCAGAGAAP